MNRIKTRLLAVAASAIASAGLMAPAASEAGVIQLGFILDESGSVGSSNWNIVRAGLSNAINALVPTTGEYQVSVIKFGQTASTVVAPTLITSAAIRSNVAGLIAASPYGNQGATNYAAAFTLMQSTLIAGGMGTSAVDFSYVNFATDGEPNSGGNGVTQRDALIAAGVDNISIEGIAIGSSGANFLRTSICHPTPCDATAPYNFPTNGFYIQVDDFNDYGAAIASKIRIVTGQPDVPEPASLALLGLGLAGVGFAARRRKALAA